MKKFACFFFSLLFFLSSFSQFTVKDADSYIVLDKQLGVDYIFVLKGIKGSTKIKYTSGGADIKWAHFSTPNTVVSNQDEISPEDATGYILTVDGKEITMWVFDYQNYQYTLDENELKIIDTIDACKQIELVYSGGIPAMNYTNKNGVPFSLKRDFTLEYQTLKWSEDSWQETEEKLIMPLSEGVAIEAPLKDTYFRFSGDRFAKELGIDPLPFIESVEYKTQAIACHITSSVIIREALNESERPKERVQLKGSAPLDISFKSNTSNPNDSYFNWTIYKNGELLIKRSIEDHLYTFSEPGSYKVKLSVSASSDCLALDSVEVAVSESLLEVPNVFTPNGDGKNDEFRVAYRSLESFSCWVYDSWGSRVFHWTNPEKGWDGRINGKNAPAGTYFYIIKAKGTDEIVYNLKGDINIIR